MDKITVCLTGNQQVLSKLWGACDEMDRGGFEDHKIYYVLDRETASNTDSASVRHLHKSLWLYHDNVLGFDIITAGDVDDLGQDPNYLSANPDKQE